MPPAESARPRRWLRLLARAAAMLLLLLVLLSAALYVGLRHPLPEGQTGFAADELAHSIEKAVRIEDWRRTGAVRWSFFGHKHLWDRHRNFARVRWANTEVLLDVANQTGEASDDGKALQGTARARAVADAYKIFINDMFWLNPLVKLFDPGVQRALVTLPDGRKGLLVYYSTGGVTPGDRYLWLVDDKGLPTAWRLWVSVLPIPGIEISWEGWQPLSTTPLVSTLHRTAIGFDIKLRDVEGAETLPALEPGPDPFAPLVREKARVRTLYVPPVPPVTPASPTTTPPPANKP